MGKTHTTLSIDEDLRRQAKENNINLTETLNDALRLKIAQFEGNVAEIDIIIEEKRLKKAQKEAQKWQNMVKNAQNNIENWQKIKEKEQIELLEKQKAEAETMQTCKNCGIFGKSDTMFTFKIGNICKGCYMVATGEQIKRWQND